MVVYTVITYGYDNLIEVKPEEGVKFICFTDNKELKSNSWEIRPIPGWTETIPPNKKQRILKLCPHLLFPDEEISVYVDGNVQILAPITDYVNECLGKGCDVCVPQHPSRNCLYQEAVTCAEIKKDTAKNILPQIYRLRDIGFPAKFGLYETNIMFRKHNTPDCIRLMEKWALWLLIGSHRDQLSFTYAIWETGVKVHALPKTTKRSKWFKTDMRHSKKTKPLKAQPQKKQTTTTLVQNGMPLDIYD